ncbi:MAG: peptidylprolyl isomerase, partial [Deltaproteobacteria bacterium]|nr:peptidylprolyl isomerase [Deltaproteobacteria bacterium]
MWSSYLAEAERRRAQLVDISPLDLDDTPEPNPREAAQWLAANRGVVESTYETERHRWIDLPLQVRARHILIRLDERADEAAERAARARMDGIVARLRRGESFAALARELSEDPGSARRGGDLDWNQRGRMVEPFDTTMFSTRVGRRSRVIRTRFGIHVLFVEGRRSGDIPRETALLAIATRMLHRQRMAESARALAESIQSRLARGDDPAAIDEELARSCPSSRFATGPRLRTTPWFHRGDPDTTILGAGDVTSTTFSDHAYRGDPPGTPIVLPIGTDLIVLARVESRPGDLAGFTDEVRACLSTRRNALQDRGPGLPDDPAARETARRALCAHGGLATLCAPCVPR